MENLRQRKQRSFDSVSSIDEAQEFLQSNFKDRKLSVKYSLDKKEARINEFLDDRTVMLVTEPDHQADDIITLYALVDRYFELDLKVEEVRGPGYYRCSIRMLRKAMSGRKHLRFKMSPERVIATNFKISKHTIEVSDLRIPTSIKVILEQFQSQNSKLGDVVRVDVFQPGDPLLDQVKKTAKTIFVEDMSRAESYKANGDDFIDVAALYGAELNLNIKKNSEKGYRSIIIVPIIYITESGQPIPFAYIQVVSKKETYGIDKVLTLKELSFGLVDRIRDANTILIPVHQEIVDVSLGGARLMFTDENLKKYVMRSKGFIFDIVFKLQAPITIYGEIRFTFLDEEGRLFAGVDFAGNSSRKDEMKRFYSIIRPMEMDYKNRLIKEMKQQQKKS